MVFVRLKKHKHEAAKGRRRWTSRDCMGAWHPVRAPQSYTMQSSAAITAHLVSPNRTNASLGSPGRAQAAPRCAQPARTSPARVSGRSANSAARAGCPPAPGGSLLQPMNSQVRHRVVFHGERAAATELGHQFRRSMVPRGPRDPRVLHATGLDRSRLAVRPGARSQRRRLGAGLVVDLQHHGLDVLGALDAPGERHQDLAAHEH